MEDKYYKWYMLMVVFIGVQFLIASYSRGLIKADLREIKQVVQCSQGLGTTEGEDNE